MAWRFVTHACGHQERINVDGPYVVVEQRVRNAERVSCPACIGIASRQRNRLDGFCELWGSKSGLRVKMCVWLGVSRGLDLAFLNAD